MPRRTKLPLKNLVTYKVRILLHDDFEYLPWPMSELPQTDKEAKRQFEKFRTLFPPIDANVRDVAPVKVLTNVTVIITDL